MLGHPSALESPCAMSGIQVVQMFGASLLTDALLRTRGMAECHKRVGAESLANEFRCSLYHKHSL